MDDQSRLAIHKAVASNVSQLSAVARPVIDVYSREAAALLSPGLAHRDVLIRVSDRMGLEPVHSKQTQCVKEWEITQSTKYTHLRVSYESDRLVSWELVPKPGR